MKWPEAQQTLVNPGLQPEEHIVPGDTTDLVTATDPPAGQLVPKGSKVRVNVMSGPKVGGGSERRGHQPRRGARRRSTTPGSTRNPSLRRQHAPQGQVVSQNPAPGTSEPQGTTVNLNVSNGPPQVTVPDVVGYTSQQAVSTLEAAGFKVTQQYIATDASQAEHRPVAESGRAMPRRRRARR